MAGSRIGDEEVRRRWHASNEAFKWATFIGAGEWVRYKARGSVGPEMYVAGYFEDHARPRTQQIARYRVPLNFSIGRFLGLPVFRPGSQSPAKPPPAPYYPTQQTP